MIEYTCSKRKHEKKKIKRYKKSQWLIGKWKKITAHLFYTY